jgi:hypothetical protein
MFLDHFHLNLSKDQELSTLLCLYPPTTVAILVCPPMWVDDAHHKVPNYGARHQEGTELMSPKTQSAPPILVEWAKGMHHP